MECLAFQRQSNVTYPIAATHCEFLTAGRIGHPLLGSQQKQAARCFSYREGRLETSSPRWKHNSEATESQLKGNFQNDIWSRSILNASSWQCLTDRRKVLSSVLLVLPWTTYSSFSLPTLAASNTKLLNKSPFSEERILEQNKRMQKLNNSPLDFPSFIREGFDVRVVSNEKYVTTDTGLIYLDIIEGNGDCPKDGQQVIFHYTGYNESGRRVDSSYQQGQPAKTRIGIKGMIPGFEEGIKTMRPGGKRRLVIPPELGPPVGPSTFFSAKQFEVFDVELLGVKDCNRRTIVFYSDVVCD